MRSRTDRPCPRLAVVEIWGLLFCKPCAREQEAYFAIGELMQEAQGLRNQPLVDFILSEDGVTKAFVRHKDIVAGEEENLENNDRVSYEIA